jgi:thiol-disulfide isomerase/thioredoxin
MTLGRCFGCIAITLSLTVVSTDASAEADVRLISQGREVSLEKHLVPGKFVIFDFFADWCAPCRVLTPRLERMVSQRPDHLALRKVDVINWESPVSRQHGVSTLPFLVLYGPDGSRIAAGGADQVMRVLAKELREAGGAAAPASGGGRIPGFAWIVLIAGLVIGSIVLRRKASTPIESVVPAVSPQPDGDTSPKIWFVMIDQSLEGPYTVKQLAALHQNGELAADTQVRRRGDSSWQTVGDVVSKDR